MTAIDQGAAHPSPGTDAGPDWLTEAELAAWVRLVSVFIKLPAALDAQLQRDAGVSHFEYMVLSRLSEASDHTLRMSDLAVLANGSLSRLSHVVTRLERRGWVRRESCPTDGRGALARSGPRANARHRRSRATGRASRVLCSIASTLAHPA